MVLIHIEYIKRKSKRWTMKEERKGEKEGYVVDMRNKITKEGEAHVKTGGAYNNI